MKFRSFAKTAEDIKNLDGNIDKKDTLVSLLDSCNEEDLSIVPFFIQGQIFPDHDERKLHVSSSLIKKAISESIGIEENQIESQLVELEDIGSIFDEYDIQQDTSNGQTTLFDNKDMTVQTVYETFEEIAEEEGKGSQRRKIDHLLSLFSRCSSIEGKYLTRLVVENFSIGIGQGTVRKAISELYNIPENDVERGIMLRDVGTVAEIAEKEGKSGVKNITLDIGNTPIKSMKASKLEDYGDAFDEMDTDHVLADYKYDGFRIQIHKDGDSVRLYSRRLEDLTDSLPDVVEHVQEHVSADQIVLDGEIVGYESKSYDSPLSYQETLKRSRRKYNIDEMVDEIPVLPKVFDVLYYQDSLLIDEPLTDRLEILDKTCDRLIKSNRNMCDSVTDIKEMLSSAQADGHEGCIIKHPNSSYEPNSRGKRWMKLKPEGETIDCVVINGEYGDGRKQGLLSSLEVALWEDETRDNLQSVGKAGTGLDDDEIASLTEKLEDKIIKNEGQVVHFKPEIVIEVSFEEVQESPKYESGYSLRFPEIKRVRTNLSTEDADTIGRLEQIK